MKTQLESIQEKVCKSKKEVEEFKQKYLVLNDILDGLDLEVDGYGGNYLIDVQEAYFQMKFHAYQDEFINEFTVFAAKFNYSQSLQNVQQDCVTEMVRLFRFTCSLGPFG